MKIQLLGKLGVIGLFLFLSQTVFAQQRQSMNSAEMAKEQASKMKSALQLSDEQTAKVEELHLKYMDKMKEQKTSGKDRSYMRQQMQVMQEEKESELKSILNDEQWQIYQSKKDELEKAGRKGGGKRSSKGRID